MLRVSRSLLRNYGVSARAKSSLVETHEMFLNLVKDQGEGDINMINHDNYVEIVLNNPTKRNAVSGRMMFQFANIIDTLVPASCGDVLPQGHKFVGVVVRGTGKEAFCSGADLSLVKEVVNTPQKGGMMSMFMTDALNRLHQSGLISVCVLNGPALGGGSEFSTACDFRVMPSNDKVFVQFIHAKIGASPGWGGAHRLTKMIGRRSALRMIATSPRLYAQDALAINYADHVIEPHSSPEVSAEDYYRDAGVRFLQPYLDMQFPGSVRAIKQAVAAADELETDAARSIEMNMFRQRWGGADNKAALTKK